MSEKTGDPLVFQDTFEEIIKQNMEDFEMDRDEAVEDARQQLKSQGVDTRLLVSDERAASLVALIGELSQLAAAADSCEQRLSQLLQQLEQFCAAGLPQRCLAGRRGAYPPLVAALPRRPAHALATLAALQDGQPDLFRAQQDAQLLIGLLEPQPGGALRWAAAVTLKHEANRQALAEAGLLARLASRLHAPQAGRPLLPVVCQLVRQMTLDDDIRVPYGRAHEHACKMVQEHAALDALMRLLAEAREESALAAELLFTCTKLCVRKEFCEQLAAGDGIPTLLSVLRAHSNNAAAVGRSFFLLRTLAGSDEVKASLMRSEHSTAAIVAAALDAHKKKSFVSEAAFAAIGALTLRSAANAAQLADGGLIPIMVDVMEQHPGSPRVQKMGCLAVRNMVSRSPDIRAPFRELGIESLINAALQAHGAKVDAEARAALRDLGCEVNLKEEWTGRGGALTTGLIKVPEQLDDFMDQEEAN